MPFRCPQCHKARSLTIASALELPPDSRSDEITLQIVVCTACPFEGLAVYEESRRGAWGTESVDHRGYYASPDDLDTLRRFIRACPTPSDPRCDCATHHTLGTRNPQGRWNGLARMRHLGTFPMEL
jgi:hypothetical protein